MPAGPPPGQSGTDGEESDDDIPMPDGPPPPRPGDPLGKHVISLISILGRLSVSSPSFAALGDSGQPAVDAFFTAVSWTTTWPSLVPSTPTHDTRAPSTA